MKSHARNQEKLINPVLVDAIHDNIFLIINLETFELRSCLSPFQTVVAIVICRQAIPDALYRSYSFHVLHVFSQTLYFFLSIMPFYQGDFGHIHVHIHSLQIKKINV